MRVMITGAHGQLGQALQAAFTGEDVLALGRAELDVADPQAVERRLVSFHPELILHAGALTDVDRAEREPVLAYRINALGTKNLALAARRLGARLLYVSTDYAFSGDKGSPYLEYDPVGPLNHYGRSKLAGEAVVREIMPEHYIVRTSWVFGPGGQGNFLKAILKLAQDRPVIQVVDDQFGSPTYTRDLAAAIRVLVRRPTFGTYHLVNAGECSRLELAVEALRLAGSPTRVEPVTSEAFPRPARRPVRTSLATMMWELEGHPPLPPWTDAVRRYLSEV